MSVGPVQLSLPGTPLFVAAVGAALDTVQSATHIPSPTGRGMMFILEGVDYWVSGTAVTMSGWITPGSLHQQWVVSGAVDPLDGYTVKPWRGGLPIYEGESLEVGVECATPASLGVMAWGRLVPAVQWSMD